MLVSEVVKAIDGELLKGDGDTWITGVSTDTRSIKRGEIFFALKGENTDGHLYVPAALDAGAAGVVVSDLSMVPKDSSGFVIKTEDTLWALGELAAYYRGKFSVQVVGVTGSVGKTTTKEMLASILSRKYRVLKSEANFNNEIGVPLTIFGLDSGHEKAVIEMAMRGLEEIRRLAKISKPSVGIVTNVGLSHIERLGSQSAIAQAKSELLEELPPDGLAVINAEDGYFSVLKHHCNCRVITFGTCKWADVIGARVKSGSDGKYSFVLLVEGMGAVEIKLPVLGYHNVYNALAAAAAAVGMGIDLITIRDGLENFEQPEMRMELVTSNKGFAILNDCYNASPASVLSALKTLSAIGEYRRKVVVLGDMLELGDYAPKAHRDIGCLLAKNGVEMLVTVGPLARMIAEGAKESGFPETAIMSFTDSSEAAHALVGQFSEGDIVLIKGSRGMRMDEIVKVLLND
jgi:UDP-N-acetylmuramoyl-tripeptide--D-alanyl-D-alanine ligase